MKSKQKTTSFSKYLLIIVLMVSLGCVSYLSPQFPRNIFKIKSAETSIEIRPSVMTSSCFETPKLDDSLSNDKEFGPTKAKTTTNLYGAVLGKVNFLTLEGLTDNSEVGKVINPAGDDNLGNLSVGTSSGHAAQTFEARFATGEEDGDLNILTGAKYSYTPNGDLKGLAVSKCQEPKLDYWMIGGSTKVSNFLELNLINSNQSASQVYLTVYGNNQEQGVADDGSLKYVGDRQIGVGGNSSVKVLLSGGAQNQDIVAVHIHALYSPIAATIFERSLNKLTPYGVDYINETNEPAENQVISGIHIANTSSFLSTLNLLAVENNKKTKTVIHAQFVKEEALDKSQTSVDSASEPDSVDSKRGDNLQNSQVVTKTFELTENVVQDQKLDFLNQEGKGDWTVYLSTDDGSKFIASAKMTETYSDSSQEYGYISSSVAGSAQIIPLSSRDDVTLSIATTDEDSHEINYSLYNKDGEYIGGDDVKISQKTPLILSRTHLKAKGQYGVYANITSRDDINLSVNANYISQGSLANISSNIQKVYTQKYNLTTLKIH